MRAAQIYFSSTYAIAPLKSAFCLPHELANFVKESTAIRSDPQPKCLKQYRCSQYTRSCRLRYGNSISLTKSLHLWRLEELENSALEFLVVIRAINNYLADLISSRLHKKMAPISNANNPVFPGCPAHFLLRSTFGRRTIVDRD